MAADEDELRILMEAKNWQNAIVAVLHENDELIGRAAFCIEDAEFRLSLGLRSDLTGEGPRHEFLPWCANYAISQYKLIEIAIRLRVALFN